MVDSWRTQVTSQHARSPDRYLGAFHEFPSYADRSDRYGFVARPAGSPETEGTDHRYRSARRKADVVDEACICSYRDEIIGEQTVTRRYSYRITVPWFVKGNLLSEPKPDRI